MNKFISKLINIHIACLWCNCFNTLPKHIYFTRDSIRRNFNFSKFNAAIYFVCFFTLNVQNASAGECHGRIINPITDICWSCIFPISIGGVEIAGSNLIAEKQEINNPICSCPKSFSPVPVPGIAIGFSEPIGLMEVVRDPYCMVGLGGIELGSSKTKGAQLNHKYNSQDTSFYHVHYYHYPVLSLLGLLSDLACIEHGDLDIGYMSELDPLWNDDELAFLLNPESKLFANPMMQVSCAAECSMANIGKSVNSMPWCGGCHGSMYPLTGTVANHVGGVQASSLLTQRVLYKLHNSGLMMSTSGKESMCFKTPSITLKKSQYKSQIVYPIPNTSGPFACNPLGRSDMLWGMGKEFPYKGEDFVYLIWRKRNCCAL